MPIKTVQFMIVLLGLAVFGRMSIAGTWIDDFSNLRDWGAGQIDDELSAAIVGGRFNFIGKKQKAIYRIKNGELGEIQDFSLELKFMVGRIQMPEESSWSIQYYSFIEERSEYDGLIDFEFRNSLGVFEEPKAAIVSIIQYVPEQQPPIGRILRGSSAASTLFAYEKEVWYTLRIEREGNQYTFWIGDVGIFAEDDSVPMGWIALKFHGRCNIWLDDFTVTGPTVPNGGPGVLGVDSPVDQLSTTWGRLKAQY